MPVNYTAPQLVLVLVLVLQLLLVCPLLQLVAGGW
jgi:hypothetical protein